MPARTRLPVVLVVLLAALLGLAMPAGASPAAKEEPLDEGWIPATRRQRVDAPSQSAGYVVGQIRIPAIGVDETVRAGVADHIIDQGPAQWMGTASAGTAGNMVIAGHRTTHSAPFRHLDSLEHGDLVTVTDPNGFEVLYRVVESFVVTPDDVWITWDNGRPYVTLFACHPLGSAAQRIVVRAEMVAGRLIA
jgi:sortase A